MKKPSRLSALYDAYLRKAPKQSRSRTIVEAILAAGVERLSRADDDEDSITVNEVAARAGVGPASLYDYFRDRKALLTAVAAKVTEDNLRAFEAMLRECEPLDLETMIGRLVDFTFDTYTTNKFVPRRILRIAVNTGLMPTLAEGQTRFAAVLAHALSKRSDVDVGEGNLDHASFVAVQSMMGLVGTIIWQDVTPLERRELRAELVRLFLGYFQRPVR